MRWLYLHFPSLLLDHYAMTAPGVPLALSVGTPPLIAQANSPARKEGIQPGQALATARALCPHLRLFPANNRQQESHLREVATSLYTLAAPLFLWPPDGILVDADALKRLHGEGEQLKARLERHLRQRALQVQSALASTPRMARLLARTAPDHSQRQGETLEQLLALLPVTATDWPQAVKERLQRMGLKTLGQLLHHSPGELSRRLGPEVSRELQYLRGERREALDEFQPPPFFQQHLELAQETASTEALRFPLQRLLQDLESFLRQGQHTTDQLLVKLRQSTGESSRLRIRLTRPEHRVEAFMPLISLHLERLTLSDSVTAVRLRVTRLLPLQPPAGDLFGSPAQHQEELATLIGKLRARLGERQVRQIHPRRDHRPEHAWQWRQSPEDKPLTGSFPLRPLWLVQPPEPLHTSPEQWLSGPERIQGGWWDGDYVRRDYYIARLPEGRRAWLYRNAEGQWFIHGWFG